MSTSFHKRLIKESKKSVCTHHLAACVYFNKRHIISTGYNKEDDDLRVIGRRKRKKIPSLHAEVSALINAIKSLKVFRKNSAKKCEKRKKVKMIVIRFKSSYLSSKPCSFCVSFMKTIERYIHVSCIYYIDTDKTSSCERYFDKFNWGKIPF
jgi:deoxycytidylate deaminase